MRDDMTETTLTVTNSMDLAPGAWEMLKEQAGMLVRSGFLPPALNTPEKVIAVALKGKELGVPMMEALAKIDIIQGKPAVAPQLMLALALRTGQVEWHSMDSNDQRAIFAVKRRGMPEPFTAEFGIKEATQLSLIAKDNYRKQARTMFEWRAIAKCLRFAFPDAISGLYTPEELGAKFDEETGAPSPQHEPIKMPQEIPPAEPEQKGSEKSHIDDSRRLLAENDSGAGHADDAEIDFPSPDDQPPSDALWKHFRAVLRETGLTEKVKSWCQLTHGKTSSKDLTEKQIKQILELIEKGVIHAEE